jgi:peptide chain release factor subunit 1
MKLTNLIKTLGSFEPDGYTFLSLYLNTEANETGRENYPVWLKKRLSEEGRTYNDDPDGTERFGKVIEKINGFVDEEADPAANGIAIFAALGDEQIFEAVQLAVPFRENQMFRYDRPYLFPLVRAIYQNPRYAVLWADTNKADIYIFGGENRIRSDNDADERVENIQNRVTNRTQVGGWSQARFQRHVDNFHLQHAKEVVAELEEIMRKKEIDQLILCGDETTIIPILRPQLSKAVDEKIVAVINMSQYDSTEEIHTRTLEAIGIENATRDKAKVEDVNNAAKAAAGLGTLGVADTLRALSNGQAQELVLSADIDSIEYGPAEIEGILEEYRPHDEHAPTETLPIGQFAGEVADQLILRAINTDAKITFIEDASLLRDAGGVGSILRYNMRASGSG